MNKSNDMRFDVPARVEVWVTQEQIAEHAEYAGIVNGEGTAEDKTAKLRELAARIARECIAERNRGGIAFHDAGFEITADIQPRDANIDRVNWDVLATPEMGLDFMLMVTDARAERDYEVHVEAKMRLTQDGWEVIEATGTRDDGGEADSLSETEQIDEACISRAEKLHSKTTHN